MQRLASQHVGPGDIDNLSEGCLGRVVDHHTIGCLMAIGEALLAHGPPEPAHEIVPKVVSFWNHVKGGQDVTKGGQDASAK